MKLKIHKETINPSFFPLLLDNEHSVILMIGGAGSSKSFFSCQRAVIRCLQDKRKYLVVRKSAVDLERSIWADMVGMLERYKIKERMKINKTLHTIEFPNGSIMLFMGLDNPDKVKSIPNITDIIVQEASEITFDDYSQLRQRMRGSGKLRNQMVLQSNPVSKANFLYKFFFQNGCQQKNCLIHRSTYKDNPHLNAETIAALEAYKTTNPYFYTVYCLGQWGTLGRTVYTNWRIETLNLNELRKANTELAVGIDFGFCADMTAIISSLVDEENKKIYVFNEFCETGLINPQIANQLELMGLAKSTIIADSAEPKSIQELHRLGIRRIKPSVKGPDSVRAGIQKLQQYEIIVDSSCFNTIEELQNYCWKKDKSTGEYLNEPIDDFNHCLDALRYSLQGVKRKASSLDLGVLGI